MVSSLGDVLSGSLGKQLVAAQNTARAIETTSRNLSTGLRVNSALDNPSSFFLSQSLSSRAVNLGRVLDGIIEGLRSLETATNGLVSVNDLVLQAQSQGSEADNALFAEAQNIGNIILADNPVVFYDFQETIGTTVTNYGSGGAALNGVRTGATPNAGELHFGLSTESYSYDGVNDRVSLPNSPLINTAAVPERTVEFIFQADTVAGRQVLFEEGGATNAISAYIDDGRFYVAANDAGDFGPFDISAEIEAGKTYHGAFVLDSAAGTFTGYLNGEVIGVGTVTQPLSAHSGAVAIGRNAGGTVFHDGPNGGNGEYFNGRISEFALYNSVLTQSDLRERYDATKLETAEFFQNEIEDILEQIDGIVQASQYLGVNLLQGDKLITNLNENGSSQLLTQGQDVTFESLGFSNSFDFSDASGFFKAIGEIDDAVQRVRNLTNNLANAFGVLETRSSFTQDTINTLNSGAQDLVVADLNEEAAELLALQARQQIQAETFSFSVQRTSILDLANRDLLFNR